MAFKDTDLYQEPNIKARKPKDTDKENVFYNEMYYSNESVNHFLNRIV